MHEDEYATCTGIAGSRRGCNGRVCMFIRMLPIPPAAGNAPRLIARDIAGIGGVGGGVDEAPDEDEDDAGGDEEEHDPDVLVRRHLVQLVVRSRVVL